LAEDPITSVALGTGKVLDEISYLKKLLVPTKVEF
jgi:actin-like ATPase involved in cell morphogenesis